MKTKYSFKAGGRVSGDAQVVGERLEALRDAKLGLTAEAVLEDAIDAESPLHRYFTWDDSEAARKQRLFEARHLIQVVTVSFEPVEAAESREVKAVASAPAVRAFVSVGREGRMVYESTEIAMNDAGMRQQVLRTAHADLAAVGRKYRELQELAGVFEALDRVGQLFETANAS